MGADASIYSLLGRGVQPVEDPINALTKALQVQGLQRQSQMQEQAYADDQALRDATRASGGDNNRLLQLLQQGGQYGAAEKVRKAMFDAQKGEADIGKIRSDTAENEERVRASKLKQASERLTIAGQAFGFVRDNPTVEAAHGAADYLGQNGIWTPEQVAAAKQRIMDNPTPEAIKAIATQAYQSALSAKDQLPNFVQQSRGGTVATQSINPVTGQVQDVQSATVTESEAQRLARERAAADAAAGRAVQIRGQNLTDARQREANDISKGLANEKRQLEVDALKEKADAAKRQKDAGISSVGNQIAVIDKALKHPGRETATGLSGSIDPRNYIPGTNAADFRAVLDQIGGAAFLQAFESLKGGGQITEVEGKKATDAIARLSRAQSDGEFKQSLNDLRDVMTTGYKRLAGKDYQGAQPSAPADASFQDAEKERRYQEWKRKQGG